MNIIKEIKYLLFPRRRTLQKRVSQTLFGDIYKKNKANNCPRDYVVIDTETTGLNPETERIIELSAIKVKNGKVVARFSTLIYPGKKISKKITNITGIRNKDVYDKPPIEIILPRFKNFIEDYTLVAHNIRFDINMLNAECIRCRIGLINNPLIDTVSIAKKIIEKEMMPNYKLETIKKVLGIDVISHRAMSDCEVCNYIYKLYINGLIVKYVNSRVSVLDKDTMEIKEDY